jgi:pectinesterase
MPADKSRLYPGLIIVHGGGWRSGNKSMNTSLAQQLARNGFVVVSVEYRLSLEAKYPAAVHDLKAAIRWMRTHSSAYNINTNQIALIGASAGGQLASLVGATNNNMRFEGNLGSNDRSSSVQAVVDLDGLLDFTAPESIALKRNENSADVFWLGGFFEDNPERWKEASAISWVTKNSPPFLFINSKQTRFHAGCKEMVEKLETLGVYSEVQRLDAPHSYWLFHPWFNPTVRYIVEFLNRIFNPELEK